MTGITPGVRIRGVLFDVDGTMYVQAPLRFAMACEMAVAYVMGSDPQGRAFARRISTFRKTREELRGLSAKRLDARQYVLPSERLACRPEDVELVVKRWMFERPLKWLRYVRRPGLIQCLDGLRASGVRLGVFSDYPADDKLAALSIRDRFDFALSATDADIDAFKPNPRGFIEAARRWGFPPAEVLYVGDRCEVDAAGAHAAGMGCVVIGGSRTAHGSAKLRFISRFEELERVVHTNCCD